MNHFNAGDKVKNAGSIRYTSPVMTVVEQTGSKVKVSYGEPGHETTEEHHVDKLQRYYEPKENAGKI